MCWWGFVGARVVVFGLLSSKLGKFGGSRKTNALQALDHPSPSPNQESPPSAPLTSFTSVASLRQRYLLMLSYAHLLCRSDYRVNDFLSGYGPDVAPSFIVASH